MKLKILKKSETPENAVRRVVISHESGEFQEWIRDTMDNTFLLWSNVRGKRGDMVYSKTAKRMVEVDSPYEEVLDEDGYGTGEYRLKEGLIAFPVDIYEHSGIVWSLSGEGYDCQWDTTHGAFVLYTDEERWNKFCGDCMWEFADGKPTDKFRRAAREIARAEVKLMNLCEQGYYYSYEEELLTKTAEHIVSTTDWRGTELVRKVPESECWETGDSCGGFLTDNPARDMEFPVGCPVVTDEEYLVGDTFEQSCYALFFERDGKRLYCAHDGGKRFFVEDPGLAMLLGDRKFLDDNIGKYATEHGVQLAVEDVTEKVWGKYPECKGE